MATAEIGRLEARVLQLLRDGQEVHLSDLRRDFPSLDEAEIQRVRSSAEILHGWLHRLGGSGDATTHGAEASWLESGARIGGYVVLRRIPGGGMGQVYLAVQESLYPRQVALKVVRLGSAPERALRNARREAEVASRLVHPHLVAVHDMGHDEERGLAWFSMQFVDGPDLRAELGSGSVKRDRAAVRRLVTRISEVAGALAELHARGYVHRDVKPENILLRRNAGRDGMSEAAVLVDFGLVRAERALHGDPTATFAGTRGYAPPEAGREGCAVTPAWDVYSLGVVLFELLQGRPLAHEPRGRARIPSSAELSSLRAATPALDADLLAILSRATHENDAARYRDAASLQVDLERWLAGESVSARRWPLHELAWRTGRKHPWRFLLGVSLPFLLVALWLVSSEVAVLRQGLAALRRGDLALGWDRLSGVHPLFVRAFFDGPEELEDDLRAGTQRHPVSRVAAAYREQGHAAAFELAAAFIEEGGFHANLVRNRPELQDYFLRALEVSSSEDARAHALRSVARLFFEIPVQDSRTSAVVTEYRTRLRRILESSHANRDERLHAACALGGCGTPRDLRLLFDWMDGALKDGEVLRLGLRSCERIIRRARLIELQNDLSATEWREVEERLISSWREWRESTRPLEVEAASPSPGETGGWTAREWLEAWAFLHRITSYTPQVPEDLVDGNGDMAELVLHAALFGPTDMELQHLLSDWIENREGLLCLRDLGDPYAVWGGLCAYVDSEELRTQVESCLQGDRDLELFRDGWRKGLAEVRKGPVLALEPDPASYLRFLLDPDPGDEFCPAELEEVEPARDEVLASWRFNREGAPIKMGAAGYLTLGRGTRWEPDVGEGTAHLRLPRSGAWVEAPSTSPRNAPTRGRPLQLRIDHLAASRPYLPFEGDVRIRLELDGDSIAEGLRVQFPARHELVIPLDRYLAQGPHVLRVTLLESTTTYWIFELAVEAGE